MIVCFLCEWYGGSFNSHRESFATVSGSVIKSCNSYPGAASLPANVLFVMYWTEVEERRIRHMCRILAINSPLWDEKVFYQQPPSYARLN